MDKASVQPSTKEKAQVQMGLEELDNLLNQLRSAIDSLEVRLQDVALVETGSATEIGNTPLNPPLVPLAAAIASYCSDIHQSILRIEDLHTRIEL